MRQALESQVRRTIRKYGMLSPGDHVLVAASGGADSTALLFCLKALAPEFKLSLTVAHLNHRIRAAESDADEEFVRNLAAGLGLPLISETAEIKQLAADSGCNLEEVARWTRYEFLHRSASRVEAQKIAVGHTLNDQAETILFRFIRGSGIDGLSAIYPVVDGVVVRPLIECSRKSIEEYLRLLAAPYREDSSNRDLRHTRNRIRHELIPYLEQSFNPQVIRTLSREALLHREIADFIKSQAKQAFDRIQTRDEKGLTLDVPDLLKLHPGLQKEVLRHAVKECTGSLRGITSDNLEDLRLLCRGHMSGRRLHLHGFAAFREFDNLLLRVSEPDVPGEYSYTFEIPGVCRVPEAGVVFTANLQEGAPPDRVRQNNNLQAFIDPALLPASLTVRSRKDGDRYGGPGHRKIKRMLIDRKIPLEYRSVIPVVAAGDAVLWIPGFRPAKAYEYKLGSGKCLVIEVQNIEHTKD